MFFLIIWQTHSAGDDSLDNSDYKPFFSLHETWISNEGKEATSVTQFWDFKLKENLIQFLHLVLHVVIRFIPAFSHNSRSRRKKLTGTNRKIKPLVSTVSLFRVSHEIDLLEIWYIINPACSYLVKFNKRSIRTRCKICSKLYSKCLYC